MKKSTSESVLELVKLGFSKQEASLYLLIYQRGTVSAKDLGRELGVSPNSLYRLLEKLVRKNLVFASTSWPKSYKVVSPRFAFDLLVKNKIVAIEESREKLIGLLPVSRNDDLTKIEIIGGARELFDNYVTLSRKAKKEILLISIGEEVSEEVLLANRDCLERGIKIRFIAHKLDQTNKDLLVRWVRMGIEVRHLPGQGFHLVIFDQNRCLLSASNPDDPGERSTVCIYSQAISTAMSQYFNSIWEKAIPVPKF